MSSLPPPQPPLDYARTFPGPPRAGLTAMGVLLIVLGALAGCVTLTIPLSLLAPRTNQPAIASILATVVIYAGVAATFIWIGIGCCRAKRWTRPLVLAIAWPWLIAGAVFMFQWFFMMPAMRDVLASSIARGGASGSASSIARGGASMPPAFLPMMLGAMTLMYGLLMLVIPATLVLFFRRARLEATLLHYDPALNFLDRCPIAVLAWSISLAVTAIFVLAAAARPIFPAFGYLLKGWPASAFTLTLAAIMLWSAWGCFRLRPSAWVVSLILMILAPASWITTLLTGRLPEFFTALNVEAGQQQLAERILTGPGPLLGTIAITVITLAYLIYLRRYFRRGIETAQRT